MVRKISQRGTAFSVLAGDTEYQAEFVIFAAPTFLAPYLMEGMAPLHDFEYSPWLTANLTLERLPDSYGTDPSWDNVFMDSPTLGYVDATHQSLRSHVDRTVWTFYWALADGLPSENRQLLLNKDWNYWKEAILHDLERVHRDIRKCVSRVDIMRLGHAMARPKVDAIFSAERRNLAKRRGRILFANSDLSGFSIFEEAQYRGVYAADSVLSQLNSSHGPDNVTCVGERAETFVLTIVVITNTIVGMKKALRVERQRRSAACPEETAFLDLLRATDMLSRGLVEVLKTEDLSSTQYNVLRILRGAPAGLPCGEIASRMITRDPDITRLLDRLEKRGLISRCRETKDRRMVMTRIAPEGLKLLARLDEPVQAAHRRQLGHLGRERLGELTELLHAARAEVS